ncbi:MAG: lysophospholipid acyltransferase family protein [Microthrixaceae bacterium]
MSRVRDPVVEPRSAASLAAFRGLAVVARGVTRMYWRLEVIGGSRVPATGAFVVAPVHRSNLDFLLAGLAVGRPVRYMAKSSVFVGGIADRFLHAMGAFPVERDSADFKAIRRCEQILAGGEPVVVFPEGRRKEGPIVKDLYDGPAFMAARQRVPIVPVGIGGSADAMPIGQKAILPRKVVLVVGEPIYPDVPTEGRIARSAVSELTATLRDAVQDVYDDAQCRAGARH